MRRLSRVATAALVLMFSAKSWALGFVNFEQGASGTGITESRTPLYDDPNTVFYNPAGMVELPGFQFSLGLTSFMTAVHYTPNNEAAATYKTYGYQPIDAPNIGHASDTIPKIFVSPHLYFTYLFKDYGVAIGFGTFSLVGMGTYWPRDTYDGRYIVTHTYLGALFNQPSLAVDIAKLAGFKDRLKLSLAVGYDLIYTQASLGKAVDMRGLEPFLSDPTLGTAEGTMKLDGTGLAHGYAFALYAELPKLLSFGLSFHGGSHLEMKGDGALTFTPAAKAALDTLGKTIPAKASGTVELNFPHVLNTGIAYLGVERWRFILDLEFAFYKGRYKRIDITFDCYDPDDATSCFLPPTAIKTDYTTGGAIDFGVTWLAKEYLELRLGGGWTFSPVPAANMDPALTDGHRYTGSIGAGYIGKGWKVDVAYMLTNWTATKNNLVGAPEPIEGSGGLANPIGTANGDYRSMVNTLALSYGMKF